MDASEQDPLRAHILRELFEMHVLDEHELRAELARRPEPERELPRRGSTPRGWRRAFLLLPERPRAAGWRVISPWTDDARPPPLCPHKRTGLIAPRSYVPPGRDW